MRDTKPPDVESTADEPDDPGIFERTFERLTDAVDHKVPWYELPKPLGLVELVGIRNTLRHDNLFDTSRQPSVGGTEPPPWDERYLTERTADGSWNDLEHAAMGMAGTRFGRNVPIEDTFPDHGRMMTPNPREVSRRLMTRENLNARTRASSGTGAGGSCCSRRRGRSRPTSTGTRSPSACSSAAGSRCATSSSTASTGSAANTTWAARPWAQYVNWVTIVAIYVGAFFAIFYKQVLFATVPGREVPVHVPAHWETGVVVGANLVLALFVWITIRKYTDSLLSTAQASTVTRLPSDTARCPLPTITGAAP